MASAVLGEVRVFRDVRANLVEGPFYDDGTVYWTDIEQGLLHVSPWDGPADGSGDRVLQVGPPLASFAPAPGGFVAALGDRVVLLDTDGVVTRELAVVEHPSPGMRLNEGKADPQGRFLVGSLTRDKKNPDASWYRVGEDRTDHLMGGFGTTNGLEWSPDASRVYLADTQVDTIYTAPWDPEAGPGELETFATGHHFDGAAMDAEGHLWCAVYSEGVAVRLDEHGEVMERVEVPAPHVSGIAFGGPDLSTLLIGGAAQQLSDDDLEKYPHAGAMFAVETAVRGLPVRRFGG